MKRIKFLLCSALIAGLTLTSCSSDDSNDNNNGGGNGGNANSPVSGTLYGNSFSLGGSKANMIEMSGVESVNVYLTAENLGCETTGSMDFPIQIITPKEVGVHTIGQGVMIYFTDPNSTGTNSSASSGSTVEVISVTETTITGIVRASSITTDNNIIGKFETPICQ